MLQKTKPKIFPKSLRTRLLKAGCFTEIAKRLFFFFSISTHLHTITTQKSNVTRHFLFSISRGKIKR